MSQPAQPLVLVAQHHVTPPFEKAAHAGGKPEKRKLVAIYSFGVGTVLRIKADMQRQPGAD
jgi:hypothetical protein